MAKKRTYNKKQTGKKTAAKRNTKNQATRLDLAIVVLFVLSILSAVLIYGKSGVIGIKLTEILGGLIGIIRYILPIGIFAVAIKIVCEDREELWYKLGQYTIFLITIATVMSTFQITSGELLPNKELTDVIKDAYSIGTSGVGGGAIGAAIAVPLSNLLGNVGALIFSVGAAILMVVFMFGIHTSDILQQGIEKSQQRKEERREARLQEMQERQERMQNRQMQVNQQYQQQVNETPQEKRKIKPAAHPDVYPDEMENQIKINFGGRVLDENENQQLKKYDHSKDDITPLTKETKAMKKSRKQEVQPDVIESNLFKQEEEQKQDKTKEVLQLEHAMIVEDEHYEYPPVELLSKADKKTLKGGAKALTETATKLQKTLYSFGVSAKVENVSVGPAITRYELKPAEGVRVSKIANLADDIALNLAAETIRIEAPIPGKQAVGIEVPNKEKEAVHLREVLESEEFGESSSKLTVALGKDVAGNIQLADIAKMPHLLIAGSTGSGKSVCINTIITSIIYKSKPSEVKMVMVDPKVVELSVYNGIPHLLIPVVTEPKKAAGALNWAVNEMNKRYNLFSQMKVKNIESYNKLYEKGEIQEKLPYIVIIVDELADLMMACPNDVEDYICRLAQMARAAGMHLIIATQRPSVDVITGVIKANIPSRVSFAVSSGTDSRTILDQVGAEKLLGRGDMLYYPIGENKPIRVQGAFISEEEVENVVDFIKDSEEEVDYSEDIINHINSESNNESNVNNDDTDELLDEAMKLVIDYQQASTSFIQRKLRVGFNRASRIMDELEEHGIISEKDGSKPRQVLVSKEDRYNK